MLASREVSAQALSLNNKKPSGILFGDAYDKNTDAGILT